MEKGAKCTLTRYTFRRMELINKEFYMKMLKLAAIAALVYTVSASAETVVLQQGLDDYNGVEDTYMVSPDAEYINGAGPFGDAEKFHLHRC